MCIILTYLTISIGDRMTWFNKYLSRKHSKLPLLVLTLLLITFAASGCIEIIIRDIGIGGNWPMYKYAAGRTGSTDDFDFETINQLWKYDFEIFEEGGGSRVSAAASSHHVVIPTRYYVRRL